MLTIKIRIILAYTVLFGVVLGLFGWVIYRAVRDEQMSKLLARIESHVGKLHSEIEEQRSEHLFPVQKDLDDIRTEGLTRVRYRVLDTTGMAVLDDSLLAISSGHLHSGSPEGRPRRMVFSLGGSDYLCLRVPLDIEDRFTYILEIAAPMDGIEHDLARLRLLLFTAIPFLLAVTGLASYLITRSAFRPLTAMVNTARKITASTLHRRLDVPRANDEVRELARTFNTMIERLEVSFRAQRQFVADASHEFQTPLTVMRSELEFAQRSTDHDLVQESVATCLSEVDHLSSMAANLLILARLDAAAIHLQCVQVRLDELLVECLHLLKGPAERKHLRFDVRIEHPVEVLADPARMKSVLLNVLDNAVKYSRDSGGITCTLTSVDNAATLEVTDCGIGIAAEDLPRVFQRFYQSDEARALGRGTGLGLAIVEGIMRLHGGSASIASQRGAGTIVTLRLPDPGVPSL
ncbi:MAG TPA: HAMP domain-containing sensor histidine kinase [Bacteroidota bacterium]|nr:HAMP domain-containing sensor histidine kinase [Bacteroidota bacterium]